MNHYKELIVLQFTLMTKKGNNATTNLKLLHHENIKKFCTF